MKKEVCIKCGKFEEQHPYGYVAPGNNKMQFYWKCRKFVKSKNGEQK